MLKPGIMFRALARFMAVITAVTGLFIGEAWSQSSPARGLPLIRDAEIEGGHLVPPR